MIRGRTPKPTVLKILEGNPGKRPINDAEPKPPDDLPKCPAHLDKTAKKCWRRIAADLHAMGVLTKIDGDALALYCTAYSRWVEANDQIKRYGMVLLLGEQKYPTVSPYVVIANAAFKQMQAMLAEFGMAPASRSRISIEKPERKGIMNRRQEA